MQLLYRENFITQVRHDFPMRALNSSFRGLDAEKKTVIAYTECINLMDYSVAVIPVTEADKSIDLFDDHYQPLNADDRKNWQACKLDPIRTWNLHSELLTKSIKTTLMSTTVHL